MAKTVSEDVALGRGNLSHRAVRASVIHDRGSFSWF